MSFLYIERQNAKAVIAIEDKRILLMLNNRDEQALKATTAKYGVLCRSVALDILGNEQDAELLVTKQWACAKMLAEMKGQDESDLDTAKYKRYRATGKFNGWSGRPCKSKFLVTNAPVDQFQKWLLDGALVEDGKFAVYP
jgi:hypothetical protein